jgi:hypothetical protein
MAEPAEVVETPEEPTLDIDSAVADIASSLKMTAADEPPVQEEETPAAPIEGGDQQPAAAEPAVGVEPAAAPSPVEERVPDTWTKEAQAKWAELPPEIRREVAKREGDIAKYVSDTAVAVKVAQGFEKVTEPYMGVFQRYNINPWNHMSNLLAAHAQLVFGTPEQKVGMFKQLAQDSGIDLAALAAGTPQTENPLNGKVEKLLERIAFLEKGVTGVSTTLHNARAAELEQSVLAYGQDEENHPFFWEVADEINKLIQSKAVETLDEAYQMAIWKNPLTKQKMIDREAGKRQAAVAASASEHAAKARKAAGGIVKTSGKGRAAPAAETVDDTLAATMANIRAREPH